MAVFKGSIGACISLAICTVLCGCQSHLPALDVYPNETKLQKTNPISPTPKPETTPKTTDVVVHIQCELAKVLNTHSKDSPTEANSKEFLHRMQNNPKIELLAPDLSEFNFVATVQLTLEVTDAEGLTPSLTFQNALMGHHAGTLGAQLSGTQDRTETLNYSVDLSRLKAFDAKFCADSSSESDQSGVQGDLGLADIVADGLLSLDASAKRNVYASAGPAPPTAARYLARSGTVHLPKLAAVDSPKQDARPELPLTFDSLRGTILFAPQSAGVQTQGAVTFNGFAVIGAQRYAVTWNGTILPPNSDIQNAGTVYFTLNGPLTANPSDAQLNDIEQRWGLSPTVTVTGSINDAYQVASFEIAGIITPAAGSDYARATSPVRFELPKAISDNGLANAPTPSAKAAAPATGSAGGTSFGSLVDFVLVYGLNGSPNFQWTHLTAITGSGSPFITATRTKTDSMAITFVPACRNTPANKVSSESLWDSLPVCDQLAEARQQGASVGYENNSLMILRNFLVRPQ